MGKLSQAIQCMLDKISDGSDLNKQLKRSKLAKRTQHAAGMDLLLV